MAEIGEPTCKGQPAQFFGNADTDMLLSIIVSLAGEVAVLRDRLDAHEQLSASQGGFSSADVDAFRPDQALANKRGETRQAYLRRVLGPALARAQGHGQGNVLATDEIVEQVTSGVPS